jgi:Zn-dependent protease/predicted transcriptional regulator
MDATIKLGRVRGIVVGIHYSWFIVFVLFSFLLAEGQFPRMYDGWTTTQYWTVAVLAVLLLFLSVLAHEFGHALVAQWRGIAVNSITLFIFGGVASLSQDSEEPGDEFVIAIAGPLVSLGLAGFFGALWAGFSNASEQTTALLGYLATINLFLAVFNLIPGFPLDGGRVLRAIIWKITGSVRRGTAIASGVGIALGTLFLVLGLVLAVTGSVINGLWTAALGWFLQNAAEQNRRAVEQQSSLKGVTARDLMNPQPVVVAPDVDLQTVADDYVLRRNARGMPVVEDGRMIGIVTVTNIREVPRERWPEVRVQEVMTPADRLRVIAPGSEVTEALRLMAEQDFHQLPVVDDGRLVGLLTRNELVRYLQTRQELGLA